jgi:hypothetical protein
MQWLALSSLMRPFLSVQHLVHGIVGTLEVRPADMLSSEVSGTHLCNYSLVGCDVHHVCRYSELEFRMIILPLISGLQGFRDF